MNQLVSYELEKFFETADIVKKRRNLILTNTEKKLFEKIKSTKNDGEILNGEYHN